MVPGAQASPPGRESVPPSWCGASVPPWEGERPALRLGGKGVPPWEGERPALRLGAQASRSLPGRESVPLSAWEGGRPALRLGAQASRSPPGSAGVPPSWCQWSTASHYFPSRTKKGLVFLSNIVSLYLPYG